MTQTRNQVWMEVVLVALTLAVGGVMLYALSAIHHDARSAGGASAASRWI